MRRAHGYGYSSVPTFDGAANGIERENDQMAEELKEKVYALKSLSIDIGNEVKHQEKLLRNMDDDYDKTSGFLNNTMNRVLRLGRGGHNYYICYLCLFAVFVLFILYFAMKLKA